MTQKQKQQTVIRLIKERDNALARIDPLFKEVQREKKKIQKLKDWRDYLCAWMAETIQAYTPPKLVMPKISVKADEESACLLISDLHWGEKVPAYETYQLNEYNAGEAADRLRMLGASVKRLIQLQRRMAPINEMLILVMGDLVTGECVFPGQAYRIDEPVIEQALHGAANLATLINEMSKYMPRIRVECIRGNHGRTGRRGQYDDSSNWDTVLYHFLKAALAKNDRVFTLIHEGEVALTTLNERVIAFSHGARLGRGALLETLMGRAATQWPDILRELRIKHGDMQVACFGHMHTGARMQIGSVEVITNGSIVGGTSYSANNIRRINNPEQMLFGVHPNRVAWFRPIQVVKG